MNCLEICTLALKRLGVISGSEIPQDDIAADALIYLQAIYRRFIYDGAFGVLRTVRPSDGTQYTACPMDRIIAPLGAQIEVSLPEIAPDCSIVVIADPETNGQEQYIYNAHSGNWQEIDNLFMTSEAPLSERDAIGLSCVLLIEMADDFGKQASQTALAAGARFNSQIINNWSNPDAKGKRTFQCYEGEYWGSNIGSNYF